jgi:hypothetical protein
MVSVEGFGRATSDASLGRPKLPMAGRMLAGKALWCRNQSLQPFRSLVAGLAASIAARRHLADCKPDILLNPVIIGVAMVESRFKDLDRPRG